MDMRNNKWRKVSTHARVNFSQSETSSLLRGGGGGAKIFITTGGGDLSEKINNLCNFNADIFGKNGKQEIHECFFNDSPWKHMFLLVDCQAGGRMSLLRHHSDESRTLRSFIILLQILLCIR